MVDALRSRSAVTALAGVLALAVAIVALALAAGAGNAGNGAIVVDSTGDAPNATPGDATCDAEGGGCTLRAAIDAANSIAGPSTITFAIPGDGPHTISPASPLPEITESVTIDGYTQDGAQTNTLPAKQGTNAILMIEIDGSNAGEDADGLVLVGGSHTVKGLVINRFGGSGILLKDGPANTINTRNSVTGNFLGTDVSGEAALGNGAGVTVQDSWWNVIGDNTPAQNNLISGNGVGVVLTGDSMDNHVRNSIIGAARDGVTPLGNESHGVLLRDGALCNTIGVEFPPVVGENIIAYNGGAGVAMEDGTGINNYVDPNQIHSNAGLGIDLGNDGVTPNDPGDLDSGPNDLQNFPVLTSAILFEDVGTLVVQGFLDSTPNTFMNLFLFNNLECDPSGHGEGYEFIHSERFTTPAQGEFVFQFIFGADVQPGDVLTATVSSPESTSEFSACITVTTGQPEYIQGDVNCDGAVNSVDALGTLRDLAALDVAQEPGCPGIGGPIVVPAGAGTGNEVALFGDVDCDGDVDAVDALKLLQFVAGLPYNQTDPCTDIGDPL